MTKTVHLTKIIHLIKIAHQQFFITFLPGILVLMAIAAINLIRQFPMSRLTRDVTAIANIHPISGVLSNLGVLLWCVTASICLFAALILHRVEKRHRVQKRRDYQFLVASSLLSLYLLFDDFFLIHEALAPQYLGVSEEGVLLLLGLVVLGYLILFRKVIYQTNYSFLIIAFVFFASSIGVDLFFEQSQGSFNEWLFFVEDGLKWLGIVSWCSYYSRTSFQFCTVS